MDTIKSSLKNLTVDKLPHFRSLCYIHTTITEEPYKINKLRKHGWYQNIG